GWVKKNEDGTVQATHAAAEDLAPATEVSLEYFFALGNLLIDKLDRLPGEKERSCPGKPET
ncbi:MAG: hypothetical protein ACK2UO_01180, partial [Caldilineaceae bacterium]